MCSTLGSRQHEQIRGCPIPQMEGRDDVILIFQSGPERLYKCDSLAPLLSVRCELVLFREHVRACMCVRVRACACARVCVRPCNRACDRATVPCACVRMRTAVRARALCCLSLLYLLYGTARLRYGACVCVRMLACIGTMSG